MEKPTWAFTNKTYFNIINSNNQKCFIFSDFEHNWDFFQFLTNDNIYYFCLNKNINTKYNFDIICKTYQQKCKHINKENIHFVIFFPEQELFIKEYPILCNFSYDKEIINILNIEEDLVKKFATYSYDDAISIINNQNKICIDETQLIYSLNKNIIKRCFYDKEQFKNIVFFGASVTAQQYSYVNYLIKNHKDLNILKKGYSGCHINQAIWLVNDILNMYPKPSICFLEWITSIYKPSSDELKSFLTIIVKKLLENNITPVFLYLYKTDINKYLDIIEIYEEIASYYNISSLHFYKVLPEIDTLDISLILKDSCHTVYDGSNLYGSLLEKSIFQYFIQNEYSISIKDEKQLIINDTIYKKYHNICVYPLSELINCSNMETLIFNEKIYYKIDKEITIKSINDSNLLMAINILHYKNNGYVFVNNHKIQTWDNNCYYKRFGYINLNIPLNEKDITILISQEKFDTSTCKYETLFPDDKYLWISELIM